jgi:hypothetical protein
MNVTIDFTLLSMNFIIHKIKNIYIHTYVKHICIKRCIFCNNFIKILPLIIKQRKYNKVLASSFISSLLIICFTDASFI